MIANVFSPSRFPELELLSVACFKVNERNVSLIASSTGNLKSASFRRLKLDSGVSLFKFTTDSNKNLKDITINISDFRLAAFNAETA